MDHVEPILLSAFLDDEVTADERKQVELHLAGCDACRGELQSLRATASLLRLLPEAPLPRTFYVTEAMVAPAPRATESWWQRLMPRLAPLGAVAAMLLVVVMGAQLLTGGFVPGAFAPGAAEPEIAVSGMPADEGDSALKGPDGAAASGPAEEPAPEAEGGLEEPSEDARVMEEPTEEAASAAMALPEATEAADSDGASTEMAEPTAEADAPDTTLVDPQPGRVEPPLVNGRGQGAGGGVDAQPGGGEGGAAASGPTPLLTIAAWLLLLSIFLAALRVLLYSRRAP